MVKKPRWGAAQSWTVGRPPWPAFFRAYIYEKRRDAGLQRRTAAPHASGFVACILLLFLYSTLLAQDFHLYIGGYGKGIYTSPSHAQHRTLNRPPSTCRKPKPLLLAVTKRLSLRVERNQRRPVRQPAFAISRR